MISISADFDSFLKKNRGRICNGGVEGLERAEDMESFMKEALKIQSVEWVCGMVGKGKLNPELIGKNFGDYINGRYVAENPYLKSRGAYTSSMYVSYEGEICATSDILTCIDVNGIINVANNFYTRIYLAGSCSIKMLFQNTLCQVDVIEYGKDIKLHDVTSYRNIKVRHGG